MTNGTSNSSNTKKKNRNNTEAHGKHFIALFSSRLNWKDNFCHRWDRSEGVHGKTAQAISYDPDGTQTQLNLCVLNTSQEGFELPLAARWYQLWHFVAAQTHSDRLALTPSCRLTVSLFGLVHHHTAAGDVVSLELIFFLWAKTKLCKLSSTTVQNSLTDHGELAFAIKH